MDYEGVKDDIEFGVRSTADDWNNKFSKQSAEGNASQHHHATSHDIVWSKVSYKVGKKVILDNCYGSVPAGKVCAILGPVSTSIPRRR